MFDKNVARGLDFVICSMILSWKGKHKYIFVWWK